jgi:hypothetical protein
MENKNLCEWRQFSGCLKTEDFDIPVIFRARLNSSGEIEFDFNRICITQGTCFIADYLLPRETGLSYFSMIGKSDDGIDLEIERIHFSSEHFYDAENEYLQLRGYPAHNLLGASLYSPSEHKSAGQMEQC